MKDATSSPCRRLTAIRIKAMTTDHEKEIPWNPRRHLGQPAWIPRTEAGASARHKYNTRQPVCACGQTRTQTSRVTTGKPARIRGSRIASILTVTCTCDATVASPSRIHEQYMLELTYRQSGQIRIAITFFHQQGPAIDVALVTARDGLDSREGS